MTDEHTTAAAIMQAAIHAERERRHFPAWEDDRIEVAVPGDEHWTDWASGSGMDGDPTRSEIALRVDGDGQFYGCLEAAIADLWRYFYDEFEEEEENGE
jgi:hypothetical protein